MKTSKFSQYFLYFSRILVHPYFCKSSQIVNVTYVWRNLSVKRFIVLLFLLSLLSIFYYTKHLNSSLPGWATNVFAFLFSSQLLFCVKCEVLIIVVLFDSCWCRFLMRKRTYLKPSIQCSHLNRRPQMHIIEHNHRSSARLRIDPKVLVLVETMYSRLGREIAELLVHNRIK